MITLTPGMSAPFFYQVFTTSMALKATIFKAQISLSDMDRNPIRTSPHPGPSPSETDERMMIRLAAFAWHAAERLEFTKGLSADDEPGSSGARTIPTRLNSD